MALVVPIYLSPTKVNLSRRLIHASKSSCNSPFSDNGASICDDDGLTALALRVVGMEDTWVNQWC